MFSEVRDEFENTEIAAYTSERLDKIGEDTFSRMVEDREIRSPGCAAVRKFADELMSR